MGGILFRKLKHFKDMPAGEHVGAGLILLAPASFSKGYKYIIDQDVELV
jgi:hypothetical protein